MKSIISFLLISAFALVGCKDKIHEPLRLIQDTVGMGWGKDSLYDGTRSATWPPVAPEVIHPPHDKPLAYFVFAISDSSVFLPNGFGWFVRPNDSLPRINHVNANGMGVWSIGQYPREIRTGRFKITIEKLDSSIGTMIYSGLPQQH